eukprot:jgi/Astpho2/4579/Aster-x0204
MLRGGSTSEFEDEIKERANAALQTTGARPSSSPMAASRQGPPYTAAMTTTNYRIPGTRPATPPMSLAAPLDLQETVDELRAEIASTRAELNMYKQATAAAASQIT